jgi:glycerophosphoryl diester phosphodiesterase
LSLVASAATTNLKSKNSENNLPALKLLASACPRVIGHRGYCAIAPENTLPSFKLALEAGADLIELDYHHSKDHVPIVFHDGTLDRTTDARKKWKRSHVEVSDKTAAEIQTLDAGSWFDPQFAGTKVPRLTEALKFICDRGGVTLIEHKSGDAKTLVQLLRERKMINRVVVISFDWKFLRQLHELEPHQVLGALGPPTHLASGKRPSGIFRRFTARLLDELAKTGAKLAVWNRQVSKLAVRLAHQRGLKVWVYTVNDRRVAARLFDLGVNGLITNNPPLIRNIAIEYDDVADAAR